MEQLRRLQALVMNTSNKPAQTGTCVLVWMSAAENRPSSVNTLQMRPPIQYIWAGLSISTVSWPLSSSWGGREDARAHRSCMWVNAGDSEWVTMWAIGGSLTLFKVPWPFQALSAPGTENVALLSWATTVYPYPYIRISINNQKKKSREFDTTV